MHAHKKKRKKKKEWDFTFNTKYTTNSIKKIIVYFFSCLNLKKKKNQKGIKKGKQRKGEYLLLSISCTSPHKTDGHKRMIPCNDNQLFSLQLDTILQSERAKSIVW